MAMGNSHKIAQWHVELNKERKTFTIYDEQEAIVATGDDGGDGSGVLIDKMRNAIRQNIRMEYGDDCSHELSQSTIIDDGLFDIPVSVVNNKQVVAKNYSTDKDHLSKEMRDMLQDEEDETPDDEVLFTHRPPTETGHYFFTRSGERADVHVVLVDSEYSDDHQPYVIAYGLDEPILIENFLGDAKDSALWSMQPIPIPFIKVADQADMKVDHEDW